LKVARNNAIAQLSPVITSQPSDQEQTPTAKNDQLPEQEQTPQNPNAFASLLPDQRQWMSNNLQNPYICAYPAATVYNTQMMYPRPGAGVIGPLDYYQFPPQQLAAIMSMTAGINTRELCVVSFLFLIE
jgi:hypothetical protein